MSAVVAKHMPVIGGLMVGTLAKFGRMLAIGQEIKARHVIGHLMMMGMAGVVATYATDLAGITNPNARTFAAAVIAIAASDVIQYLATRSWQRFLATQQQAVSDLQRARGELRQNVQISESLQRLTEDKHDS